MKTFKILFTITVLLSVNIGLAQKSYSKEEIANYTKLHIETGEGNNKKSGEGYLITIDLTKDKLPYGSILVDKRIINNATEIKLFFKREINGELSEDEPYILNFPIKTNYIVQDKDIDFVLIPFGQIHQTLEEKNIKTYEVFFGENNLSELVADLSILKVKIKESDLDKLKKIWEMKIEKYIFQNKSKK